MENRKYSELGISEHDIEQIKKHRLTHILDKIQEQQQQLEAHEKQLQKALNKIEKDLAAARDAQISLLPKELIGIPGIEFKARYHPSLFVSGDIYNVFRLDEHNLGVYHIDISGHGVPAALFSVSLSQMLNTTISKKNLLKVPAKEPPYYKINPPDKVVAALNDDQSFDQSGIYFTMVYMIINFKENRIQYTRAGHNPPILVKSDGRILFNNAGGFPVGWDFPREDPIVEMETEPGDRLFMFSDGITEATGKDNEEMFSQERMADILSETRHLPLESSLDEVIKSVRQFSGREDFEDDVSIIGLAWK